MAGFSSKRLLASFLFGALLSASIVPRPAAATVELVLDAPAELDLFDGALVDLTRAADRGAFDDAKEALRTSTSAWAKFRDGEAAEALSPVLIWRLDALAAYLRHAISSENAEKLVLGANLGLRLTRLVRRHFRVDRALELEGLRIELRELSLAANAMAFPRAERARKRAVHLWEKLREPTERSTLARVGRLRRLGSYFDICFDELENASRERDAYRMHRAARCALDLSETLGGLFANED